MYHYPTLRVFAIIVLSLTVVSPLSSPTNANTGSAFANISPTPSFKKTRSIDKTIIVNKNQLLPPPPISTTTTTTMSAARGGSSAGTSLKSTPSAATAEAPKKRVRITALDGIRSLLATHIVLGHFLRYAQPSPFLLRFFSQINVTVGAFFAISGYVTAYTTTEVQQREASPRLTETTSVKWWLSKVMSFYPMHWFVLLLFSPMFIFSDTTYGGWGAATLNGILSATLTQAWGPAGHAEVWNAPTWFLSSMVFSTAVMPFALPKIAKMDKKALRKSLIWLGLVNVLPILGYCMDHNTWGLVEGMTAPKNHPALAVFNYQRFLPMFNVAEILMGAVTCRLAMLDGMVDPDNKDKVTETPKTSWLSSTVPFVGLVGILAARALQIVPECSDLLVRGFLFTPLFLKFVLGAHRNTVSGTPDFLLDKILSRKVLVWLGGLSFPIYIVHGPIGQVFYKKLIATKLWGGVLWGPKYFALYLSTVMLSAFMLNNFFLQNKAVGNWSKAKVEEWSSWM